MTGLLQGRNILNQMFESFQPDFAHIRRQPRVAEASAEEQGFGRTLSLEL